MVPNFGNLITDGNRRRDAVHVAVIPVTTRELLLPGQHVGLTDDDSYEYVGQKCEKKIGIVDPYLKEPLEPGSRFWLFLYPDTITDLRHAWSHPDFTARSKNAQLG